MTTIIEHARAPEVTGFFDSRTNTVSYVVADPSTRTCAIIDSVLDYEPHGARLFHESADALIAYVQEREYEVAWILETHVHADHLSAATYLKERVGGMSAIGAHITDVQKVFVPIFHAEGEVAQDGTQFDRLFEDGDTFMIGSLSVQVLHTPGHTPADVSYHIGDAVFVGDTLFMPDYGTARCDFPGGSAETLFQSIQKIFALPPETRLFVGHDYLPQGRTEHQFETTVYAQKQSNIQVHGGVSETEFVAVREQRDSTLGMPTLIIPSIQVNMRAGVVPVHTSSGALELRIPVNSAFAR
jgi:glyoxylase-like metal-dependent hydrolase (beta-lactamase superfamily II)